MLSALAPNRPVFHSEADFQHAFAWQVHLADPEAVIRLETRPVPEVREAVDFWCHTRSQRVAVEFKYLVRRFEATVDGEQFRLRDQGAQPLSRYDVLKDISRLERFCATGWAEVGFVVVLSNDPLVWSPGRSGSIDESFRLHEGARLTGTLGWGPTAGAGTTRGRAEAITLRGSYQVTWADYPARHPAAAGQFRSLVIEVSAG